MLQIIDTLCAVLLGGTIWVIFEHYAGKNNNVQKDNYGKMKQRLVKLLLKDGFQNEMNEGHIVLTYRQERFVVHFDASQFGEQYARVTVADYYVIGGMNEVHPFVMDAVMGRATHNSTRTPNIAYDESCLCYYATDVRNINHFYRGLRTILDMLIDNENSARRDFDQFRRDFGRKKETSEDKHIGFRTSADEEAEDQHHSVAAETSASVK